MVHTTLSRKANLLGVVLKIGVILSCAVGIFSSLIMIKSGFMSSNIMFLYFTTQSNLWVAAICLVFLVIDLRQKGHRKIPDALYIIKYMFTVSALLTFIVFSVLLSSLLPASYLLTPSNIFLHNLTPILAAADFIVCDYGYRSNPEHAFYAVIMPLAYALFSFVLSTYNVIFPGGATVPYFFLDYQKFGWFSISSNGIGVAYWIVLISAFVLLMGSVLLKIKDHRKKKMKKKAGAK
jgi:hypothetical protein